MTSCQVPSHIVFPTGKYIIMTGCEIALLHPGAVVRLETNTVMEAYETLDLRK